MYRYTRDMMQRYLKFKFDFTKRATYEREIILREMAFSILKFSVKEMTDDNWPKSSQIEASVVNESAL